MSTAAKTAYLFPPSLLAPGAVLDTCPDIWYLTPADNSVIISASDNYHDGQIGEWEDLPPIPIEGGLLVHWKVRARVAAPVSAEQPVVPKGGMMLSLEQAWLLRATRDDARFISLCEEWGCEVAGPSERGAFLVLDNAGKAWGFTPLDPTRRLRDVVEMLWTPYNVAYMNGGLYPLPSEGQPSQELPRQEPV
jgi:hypothetical protein